MPARQSIALQGSSSTSFTVAIPVYNVERYLPECLDSVFSQDYPRFDVVMVDDGSTDGSGLVCDEYARRFPRRARVVHKGNEGLLLARREGFARATGDYVVCVDSDDVLLPGALSALAAVASATGADVIRYGSTRSRAEAAPAPAAAYAETYGPDEKPVMLRRLCCSTSGSENPMWFKAVRRGCVGAGRDFSAYRGLTFAEDFLQTLTVYDLAESFCHLDAVLYYYRPGSGITRAYDPRFYRDVCRCLDEAEGFAREWEGRYGCDGLLEGLASCRLDSAAQYAEHLALGGDAKGLDELRASRGYARCAGLPGARGRLRPDRRLVVCLLGLRLYPLVGLLARLRAARARTRGARG